MSDRRIARPRPLTAAPFLVALGVALCASIVTARAGAFNDAALDLGLRDDARVFLNVTNDYFAPPPAVAVDLVQRSPDPVNDYPVVLLLARASKRSPQEILRQRLDRDSWSDIMFRQNISPAVLFAGLDRDPGPPYGKAWGYWRKHPRGERLEIRDRDVAELAKLQVAAGYHHVSPYTIITERKRGITVEQYVEKRNRGRYSKEKSAKGQPRGRAPEKSKGHDKPKGHDHPHDNN
jgi:hypothetical protein